MGSFHWTAVLSFTHTTFLEGLLSRFTPHPHKYYISLSRQLKREVMFRQMDMDEGYVVGWVRLIDKLLYDMLVRRYR